MNNVYGLAWLYTKTLRKMMICSLSAKCIMHSSLWNYGFAPFYLESEIILIFFQASDWTAQT